MKVIAALVFGALAVCGITYVLLGMPEKKYARNRIDCWFSNAKTSVQSSITKAQDYVRSQMTPAPVAETPEVMS